MKPGLRIARSESGDLVVRPPARGTSEGRRFALLVQLGAWVGENDGAAFERGAAIAWAPDESDDVPAFVLELRSPSDDLGALHAKMEAWREAGVSLGWLLDPETRKAWVYHAHNRVEELDAPPRLDASPVVPGFVADLAEIWAR